MICFLNTLGFYCLMNGELYSQMLDWELCLEDKFVVREPGQSNNQVFIKIIADEEAANFICGELNRLLSVIEINGTSGEEWRKVRETPIYRDFLSKLLPNGYSSFLNFAVLFLLKSVPISR